MYVSNIDTLKLAKNASEVHRKCPDTTGGASSVAPTFQISVNVKPFYPPVTAASAECIRMWRSDKWTLVPIMRFQEAVNLTGPSRIIYITNYLETYDFWHVARTSCRAPDDKVYSWELKIIL